MKVLLFIDWFIPGYKAGGQLQSCANLTKALKDEIEFFVVTTDRDLGDTQPYKGIVVDEWNELEHHIRVLYLSPQSLKYQRIKAVIKEVKADCIYINSMFSVHFTIMPLLVNYFNPVLRTRLVLAPRGMLHSGALQFKAAKKRVFLNLFRKLGLHKRLTFHATDTIEVQDIQRVFGRKVSVDLVKDFPVTDQPALTGLAKQAGSLSCIFVSRVAPKKNLLYLLEILKQVKGGLQLTIAGPNEDEVYWEQCQQVIRKLPDNIKVDYIGSIPNRELMEHYQQHHVFVLPTWGENFGHVIFESFLYGRPVLISDQTPWQQLAKQQAGWELPLENKEQFKAVIEEAIAWNQAAFDSHASGAWKLANDYIKKSNLKQDYLQLFN